MTAEWLDDYKLKAESILEFGENVVERNLARIILNLLEDRERIISLIDKMYLELNEKQIKYAKDNENNDNIDFLQTIVSQKIILSELKERTEIEVIPDKSIKGLYTIKEVKK